MKSYIFLIVDMSEDTNTSGNMRIIGFQMGIDLKSAYEKLVSKFKRENRHLEEDDVLAIEFESIIDVASFLKNEDV